MVYTEYNAMISGGWLTFLIILFTILAIASLVWGILYIEMSQNKTKKMSALIVVVNALVIAFDIQLFFIRFNVVFN